MKQQNFINISLVKRKWKIFVEQKIMKSVHKVSTSLRILFSESVPHHENFTFYECSAIVKRYRDCLCHIARLVSVITPLWLKKKMLGSLIFHNHI